MIIKFCISPFLLPKAKVNPISPCWYDKSPNKAHPWAYSVWGNDNGTVLPVSPRGTVISWTVLGDPSDAIPFPINTCPGPGVHGCTVAYLPHGINGKKKGGGIMPYPRRKKEKECKVAQDSNPAPLPHFFLLYVGVSVLILQCCHYCNGLGRPIL